MPRTKAALCVGSLDLPPEFSLTITQNLQRGRSYTLCSRGHAPCAAHASPSGSVGHTTSGPSGGKKTHAAGLEGSGKPGCKRPKGKAHLERWKELQIADFCW